MSVRNKVAIVTGASSGMGQVIARAFAQHGIFVIGADINPPADHDISNILYLPLDLANPNQCRQVVEESVRRVGSVDILVNCGGVGMHPASRRKELRAGIQEADIAGYLRILQINLLGASCMAHYASEHMVQTGWGRIINVTTSFDTMLAKGLSAYGASKAALEASTASWAKDLEGTGVTCNTLVPGGPTDTNFFPRDMARPPNLIAPAIVAQPALWLVSEAANGINGARIVANEWQLPENPELDFPGRHDAAWPSLASNAAQNRGHAI